MSFLTSGKSTKSTNRLVMVDRPSFVYIDGLTKKTNLICP